MWELNNTLKEKYCDSASDVNAGVTMQLHENSFEGDNLFKGHDL
jgi:hypothetical protein